MGDGRLGQKERPLSPERLVRQLESPVHPCAGHPPGDLRRTRASPRTATMLDLFKRKPADEEKKSWSERLSNGLARSREKLAGALTGTFSRRKLDEETLEEIETALLTADVGVAATQQILDDLRLRWKRAGADDEPRQHLKAALLDLIAPLEKPLVITNARPFVIMVAGVNGAGKTTSIGKLARLFQAQGHSVLLAAGDTFRA